MNKRKLNHSLIQPSAQFRLLLPLLLVLTLHVCASVTVYILLRETMDDAALALTAPQRFVLEAGVFRIAIQLLGFALTLALVTILIWLVYTHRYFGPAFALRRKIDRMLKGDFTGEITLRRHDELHELVAQVNELAKLLASGTK